MAYMTDRKRATGRGAAGSGTEHFWHMTVTSVALVILTPLFVFVVGPAIGKPYADVALHFANPFNAIVTALMLVVGFNHFRHGAQTAIEDYSDGLTRKALVLATICISYAAMATGLFALARLAL
ncbi:succinate dehydrogenase, hydrophobic membrane anchor protein [Roseicyclus sp. F158]|uniref:Succinate dehydrogenase hydrophobic membrane anchor subunit n=1 Tax=Tropicimonas omnivorans TaxID=3075590 RepID=A0ABU3DDE6_9RHOB|nr:MULTISPECIES: succinate dehydrogenase, hydrophobic membrane anchor protein [Roseobacteraceae]MDT0681743.1 succinate dehydrogenase, hydrophobic membrane anchor protein [Roseicyclus sp. F158]